MMRAIKISKPSGLARLLLVCVLVLSMSIPAFAKVVIKCGTMDPPLVLDYEKTNGNYVSTNVKAQVFKRVVENMSKGEIIVKIFPNSQLGSGEETLEMVRNGTLDISCYPGNPIVQFVPEMYVTQVPYLFEDFNIALDVLQGPIGEELGELVLKKTGIRILAWGLDSYAQFMSAKKSIKVPSDLEDQKIRAWNSPNIVKIVEETGASSTPISYSELYTSLQQGVVDGCITSMLFIEMFKLDEQLKYICKADVTPVLSNFYASEKFWQKLTPQHKQIIKNGALQAMRVFNGFITFSQGLAAKSLTSKGIEVYFPSYEEKQKWKEVLHKPLLDWTRKKIGDEWVDKMLKAVERSEKKLYGGV